MVDVAVALVTWNSATVVTGAIESLSSGLAGLTWQLVVVDNASEDDTVDRVRRAAPTATIVQTGRNAGYAAGLNVVFERIEPTVGYLCLNADARLRAGAGEHLLAAITKNVGIAVPRLVAEDGTLHRSLRRDPSLTRALGEALLGGSRSGRWDRWGEMVMDAQVYESPRTVDWATGAVMLVTTACRRRVGPWDESFFLYSEETEYCMRTRDAGLSVLYVPDAVAWHIGGESATSNSLYSILVRNRAVLYGRRHSRLSRVAFTAVLVLNELLRLHRPLHRAGLRALLEPRRERAAEPTSGSRPFAETESSP